MTSGPPSPCEPGAGVEVGVLPVGSDVRSLLIFGGTFDPPHRAHVELPAAALSHLGIDWLVYVPARRSPFKPAGPQASDQDRIDMLRAGLGTMPRVSISTIELESTDQGEPGPGYTIDTLERIRGRLGPGVALRLLIGEDQAREFHRWREAGRIIALAEPAVMRRSGGGARGEGVAGFVEAMKAHWSPADAERWGERVVAVPQIEVSATLVREALGGEGSGGGRLGALVPSDVAKIIRARGLYR